MFRPHRWDDPVKAQSGEDFMVNFYDDYYMYQTDYRQIRTRLVLINDGIQGLETALQSTQEDLKNRFSRVSAENLLIVLNPIK